MASEFLDKVVEVFGLTENDRVQDELPLSDDQDIDNPNHVTFTDTEQEEINAAFADDAVFTEVAGIVFAKVAKAYQCNVKWLKEKGMTLLHCAALVGKIELVKFLVVHKGQDVNVQDKCGDTPLHVAVYENEHPRIAEFLVSQGVDANMKNNNGWSSLDVVKRRCSKLPREEKYNDVDKFIKTDKFIREYSDVKATDDYGWTLLHHVAKLNNAEVVELLISKGADVNAKDRNDITPLHVMARDGINIETAKLLVVEGADVNAKDVDGYTPLHWAAGWNKDVEVIKYLVSVEADVHLENNNGWTPLDLANRDKNTDVVEYLESIGAKSGK